jgi:integrase
MKTVHTFSILFWIRREKIQDGKAPVYARVTVDGKRSEISIKRNIDPDSWNPQRGMAKGTKEESRILNAYIEQVRNQLFDCYQELQKQKKLITAEAIKAKYLGLDEKEHTLISIFEHHNANMHSTLQHGTAIGYHTTLKFLKLFLKNEMNTSDMFLSQLNYKFIVDFQTFIKCSNSIERVRPCNQNGSIKHIIRFRKVINVAIKNEWLDRDPFGKFEKEFDKFNRGYLTHEELIRLESHKFKSERLIHVRDVFIFCCYTGLSYIDVFNLSPERINIGIDGNYWISITREKTDNPVKVPLLSKPLDILEKYRDHPRCVRNNKLLPVINNAQINFYLKEIAALCRIEKNVTFHMSRHTFATTVTLTNGVPIESVSAMLGHSSIKTTQIYGKIVQSKVNEDMEALRSKLEKGIKRKRLVMAG